MNDEDRLRARFVTVYRQHEGALLARAFNAAGQGESPQDLFQTAMLEGWTWFLRNPSAADDLLRSMLFDYIAWRAKDSGRRRKHDPLSYTERPPNEDDDPLGTLAHNSAPPDEVASCNDCAVLISAALQRLDNAEMRTVMELRYSDPEPTLREIAEKMGISEVNVKQLHHRAKEALEANHVFMSLAREMNISTAPQRHEP